MSRHVHRVRGLQITLDILGERIAAEPRAEHWRNAEKTLKPLLDSARLLAEPCCLKEVAAAAGISYEAMRLRLHARCPEVANAGGRFRLTPEIVSRLLAD